MDLNTAKTSTSNTGMARSATPKHFWARPKSELDQRLAI